MACRFLNSDLFYLFLSYVLAAYWLFRCLNCGDLSNIYPSTMEDVFAGNDLAITAVFTSQVILLSAVVINHSQLAVIIFNNMSVKPFLASIAFLSIN